MRAHFINMPLYKDKNRTSIEEKFAHLIEPGLQNIIQKIFGITFEVYWYIKQKCMEKDLNLQFIRNKIYDLRNAIMYSMSNELIKIPNNIVTAVRVSNEGELWFLSKRPAQFISECEQNFPARLKFYRKGIPFYIEISGMATIVTDTSEKNPLTETGKTIHEKPVLLKMSMKNIEYVEIAEKKKSRVEIAIENGYNWLLKTVAFHRHSKPVLRALRQPSI